MMVSQTHDAKDAQPVALHQHHKWITTGKNQSIGNVKIFLKYIEGKIWHFTHLTWHIVVWIILTISVCASVVYVLLIGLTPWIQWKAERKRNIFGLSSSYGNPNRHPTKKYTFSSSITGKAITELGVKMIAFSRSMAIWIISFWKINISSTRLSYIMSFVALCGK